LIQLLAAWSENEVDRGNKTNKETNLGAAYRSSSTKTEEKQKEGQVK
jgi:hypothetical protein